MSQRVDWGCSTNGVSPPRSSISGDEEEMCEALRWGRLEYRSAPEAVRVARTMILNSSGCHHHPKMADT